MVERFKDFKIVSRKQLVVLDGIRVVTGKGTEVVRHLR